MLGKCLVKRENASNFWVKDMNRKLVPTLGNMLCPRVLNPLEDVL